MPQTVSRIEDIIVPGKWTDKDYDIVVLDRILEELGLENKNELD